MTTFRDGPAEGLKLMLRRAPIFLRVVVDQGGEMDALDDPGDQLKPGEVPYTYVRTTKPQNVRINARGCKNEQAGGWYAFAEYALHEIQPERGVMTDNARWQEWCRAQYELLTGGSK